LTRAGRVFPLAVARPRLKPNRLLRPRAPGQPARDAQPRSAGRTYSNGGIQ
jgi:hypothetical protein